MFPHTTPGHQHSTARERNQSAGGNPTVLEERYGPRLLSQGFTAIPNLLLTQYASLAIGEGEFVFLLHLLRYWRGDAWPCPPLGAIAERMGKSIRQVQTYVERLRRRGLVQVIVRRDASGRQLANAYDCSPLLSALSALSSASADPLPAAGGAQPVAPPALQRPAPIEDGGSKIVFDSMSPRPPSGAAPATGRCHRARPAGEGQRSPRRHAGAGSARRPGEEPPGSCSAGAAPRGAVTDRGRVAGLSGPGPEAALRERLRQPVADVGRAFGDRAPASSLTRIARLAQRSGLTADRTLDLLREAGARTAQRWQAITTPALGGGQNAMPYFLATLESLARPAPDSRRGLPCRRGGGGRRPRQKRHTAARIAAPPDAPELWRLVLSELGQVLAPGVLEARVLPLRVLAADDARLRLEADTAFERRWLEQVMRGHIERALGAIGQGEAILELVEAGA